MSISENVINTEVDVKNDIMSFMQINYVSYAETEQNINENFHIYIFYIIFW